MSWWELSAVPGTPHAVDMVMARVGCPLFSRDRFTIHHPEEVGFPMQNEFTIAELARSSGCTEAAIRGVIARGALRVERRWGRVLISLNDAETFARARGL